MLKNEQQTDVEPATQISSLEVTENQKIVPETFAAQKTSDTLANVQNVANIETFDAEISRTLENPQSAQSVEHMDAPANVLELDTESRQLDVETKRLAIEIQRLALDVQRLEQTRKTQETDVETRNKIADIQSKQAKLQMEVLEFELKKRTALINDTKTEAETQKILKQLEIELAERTNDLFIKQAFTAITLTMLIAGVVLLGLSNSLGYLFVGGALGLIPVLLKAPAKPPESGKSDK